MFATSSIKKWKKKFDLDAHLLSTFTELNKLHNVMKCLYQITFFKLSEIIINDNNYVCQSLCKYISNLYESKVT
jgi:hypothetical protein